MKLFLTIVGGIIIIALGTYFFIYKSPAEVVVETPVEVVEVVAQSTSTPEVEDEVRVETKIGMSVENRPITAYHFGTGKKEILFIGGIHGGYSWNTAKVAYELIEHLQENPSVIPADVAVTVIPVLNPDGLAVATNSAFGADSTISVSSDVAMKARFNASGVDLNRNFDCEWKESGVWQNKTVSGGDAAFSEPETKAIREYVGAHDISAVVTWYSASGGVFASECRNGISKETLALTKTFADASGYRAYETFDFYAITGDMVNWFAKNNIPAISVLLTNHTDTEWSKNRAGVEAILNQYAE